MPSTRKKHNAAFKAQVAIEAIKGQETLSELYKRFEVHPKMIANWNRKFFPGEQSFFYQRWLALQPVPVNL